MNYFELFRLARSARCTLGYVTAVSFFIVPAFVFAETVEGAKEKIAVAIQALDEVEGDVSSLAEDLAKLKVAVAKAEVAAGSDAETIASTKAKLNAAALALRVAKATPTQVQKELSELKTSIGAFEARTPATQLGLDAASVRSLVELLKYERTDKAVLDAIKSLHNSVLLYDAPNPALAFTRLAEALEKLDPDATLSLSITPVRVALEKALEQLLTLEATRPNAAVNARAERLSKLIMTRKADLEFHRVGTNLQKLDDQVRPFQNASAEDALIQEVDALTKQLKGFDDLPKDAETETETLFKDLDALLGPLDPRAVIVTATYGDFRNGVTDPRQCDATAVLRESCDGVARCKLSSEVTGTGTVAERLCGYDPAPTAPDGALTLKVEYGCVSATIKEWEVLTAQPGSLKPGQAPVTQDYPGLLGTIACAPNAARGSE